MKMVAVALAGFLLSSPSTRLAVDSPSTSGCEGSIPWTEARAHVGEHETVQGSVVGTHYAADSDGQPTFLNVGVDYPDPDRFVVVIWGENLSNFPESPDAAYANKNICVSGVLEAHDGVTEMEAASSTQIVMATATDEQPTEFELMWLFYGSFAIWVVVLVAMTSGRLGDRVARRRTGVVARNMVKGAIQGYLCVMLGSMVADGVKGYFHEKNQHRPSCNSEWQDCAPEYDNPNPWPL